MHLESDAHDKDSLWLNLSQSPPSPLSDQAPVLGLCLVQFQRESCWVSLVKIPHLWYLTKFLIPHPGLIPEKILSSQFSQMPPFPGCFLLIFHPVTLTLFLDYKFSLMLIFRVGLSFSPLLQYPNIIAPLNKVCLTISNKYQNNCF